MNALASKAEDSLSLGGYAGSRSASEIISEGVLAGVVAASAVAVMFLVIDALAGAMLRTPTQLGGMLLQVMGASGDASADVPTRLALYTLFHFVAFIAAGIIAAAIVQVMAQRPIAVLLFVILFFAFEVAFTGFVTVVGVQSDTTITPMQVALGNVVASVAMVLFFRARHPELRHLRRALENDE